MELSRVIIHNFRSVKDADFEINPYTLVVGENNSGKTNLLSALRTFYEDAGLKYDKVRDFPKFETDDNESWVELHFKTTDEEQEGLKESYRSTDKILKVRRYFASDNGKVKAKQANIYGYENGEISDQLFYGAANISSSKLGSLIYIPAVSKVEDTLKTSGPSPFRNLIALVMKKAISTSTSFEKLNTAFTNFNNAFRSEEVSGLSIDSLKKDINNDLMQWGVGIDIEVSPINPDDIVKNLLKPHIEDQKLDGQRVDISSFGQGLQRHLIYTLIKMSAKYHTPVRTTKKDFNPDYTLILFEEPEAFLHPSQQYVLYRSLIDLANEPGQQIIISTHSALFVSKSITSIPSICKLHREGKETKAYQIKETNLQEILSNNLVAARLSGEHEDPDFDEEVRISDEAIKYFLWLDSERSNLFFARHVLLCEGPSEKVYLDYLADREWSFLRENRVYVLDCVGKFNIHRFIHLLTELGIPHSVLFDGDNDQKNRHIDHSMWNRLINDAKTPLTKGIHQFQVDLEEFLVIEKPNNKRGDLKPINVIKKHVAGDIPGNKLEELKAIVCGLTSV